MVKHPLIVKILFCSLFSFGMLYAYIDQQNKVTKLKIELPQLAKEIRERTSIQNELQEKAVVVSQHYQVLNELAKDESMRQGNLSVSIQRLTESVGKTLKITENMDSWTQSSHPPSLAALRVYVPCVASQKIGEFH